MQLTLTKLPWYAQVGAFVVLAIGACGAFYYYIEIPARADMEARQSQLVALKADIAKGLTTARKLPEFQAQVTDLVAYLETLRSGGKPTPGAGIAGPIKLPPGFEVRTIATGLTGCTALAVAADGRLFLCEQTGALRVVAAVMRLERL